MSLAQTVPCLLWPHGVASWPKAPIISFVVITVSTSNSARSLSSLNSEPPATMEESDDDTKAYRARLAALKASIGMGGDSAQPASTEPIRSSLLTQLKTQDSGSNSSLSSSSSLGASLVSAVLSCISRFLAAGSLKFRGSFSSTKYTSLGVCLAHWKL